MGLPTASEELKLIIDAGRQAADVALQYFQRGTLRVEYKENDSPVSEGDFAVDAFLKQHLLDARPSYGWLSEETADHDPSSRIAAPRAFIVDPIDGTRAYISGRRRWCISIAVIEDGRPIAGVLNCPALQEEYSACADEADIEMPLGAAGSSTVGGKSTLVRSLRKQMPGHRIEESGYVPSLAYRIAMVADGRLQGTFVRANSHEWDLAAADLIASKAGAHLVDAQNKPIRYNQPNPKQGHLVCAAPAFIEPMLNVVSDLSFS
ncbi:MAG: 3'(2'),5'-bisphosphate nucleotidase CysQ [Pseudomonadota bacterium]